MISLKVGFVVAAALAIPNAFQWFRYLRGYKQRVAEARAAGSTLGVLSEHLAVAGFAVANASIAFLFAIALFRLRPELYRVAMRAWIISIIAIGLSWFLSGWSEGVRSSRSKM